MLLRHARQQRRRQGEHLFDELRHRMSFAPQKATSLHSPRSHLLPRDDASVLEQYMLDHAVSLHAKKRSRIREEACSQDQKVWC